jgi:hypothetical protein
MSSFHKYDVVDLLEIYHARSVRNLLWRQLRRLDDDDASMPGFEPQRRQEVREQYAALLIGADELLRGLGDDSWLPGH